MNELILSIHALHDSSVTFIDKNNKLRIFEYERFCKERYASITHHFYENRDEVQEFIDHIKINIKYSPKILLKTYNWYDNLQFDSKFEKYILNQFNTIEKVYTIGHHESHAANAYSLSGFTSSLVFSMDGGGHDYVGDGYLKPITYMISLRSPKKNCILEHSYMGRFCVPGAYNMFGAYISEISKPINDDFSISNSGKCMGLSGYGNVRHEWVPIIKEIYNMLYMWERKEEIPEKLYKIISKKIHRDSLSGQDSYDLAATNQYVFEQEMFSLINPYIEKYNMNVVLSGGCALNVVFNQKLSEHLMSKGLKLYVTPNPGDEGLSFGSLMHYTNKKLKNEEDIFPYCGIDILDKDKIINYYKKYNSNNKVRCSNVNYIVDLIKDGKIGGIIQGYSEVGPRALGNRSIICDPSIPDMKNIINSKVKFREWFRPFAPVCREEDMNLYFEKATSSQFMSFSPNVRDDYKDKLPSVTHVDGSARLQTVTRDQHQLFYDILTELDKRDCIPVIMNTSFNIKGNPILTTLEDAFYVLENTELDFLVYENLLFESIGKIEHIYQQSQFGEDWFSYSNLYSDMVKKFPSGSHFVEIGSWKGKSSSFMAVEINNSQKNIKFDCIDPWFDKKDEGQFFEIQPNLYETFLENIKPLKKFINPIRSTSKDAVNLYEDESLDFVFLDGDYSKVGEDIQIWISKIKTGGILSGNRVNLEQVKNAVNSFLPSYTEVDNCWIYNKK